MKRGYAPRHSGMALSQPDWLGGDCSCEPSMRLSESRTRRLLKECRVVAGSGGELYTLCFVLRASCEAGQKGMPVILF